MQTRPTSRDVTDCDTGLASARISQVIPDNLHAVQGFPKKGMEGGSQDPRSVDFRTVGDLYVSSPPPVLVVRDEAAWPDRRCSIVLEY